jgi:glycosyltransferase involved in cell wall biosynthesis
MSTPLASPSQRSHQTEPLERRPAEPATPPRPIGIELDVVIPVHDEQSTLERSIRRLHAYLSSELRATWRIVIADNASDDATPQIARALADELPHVTSLRLERKGRGRALRAAWSASDATVVSYMDADLSTALHCLPALVSPLLSGHAEVAIGTRLAPGATVTRGLKRELISRAYNHVLSATLQAGFSDAQCGFKAVRRGVLDELLATVRDEGWFFDTELLVAAERRGLRIHEVPVDWVDDSDSSVAIVSTALTDLRGVARLVRDRHRGSRPDTGPRAHGSVAQPTGPAGARR